MRHSSLDPVYLGTRLIAYCSDQAQASIKKDCQILQIQLHIIHSDDEYSLQGHHLRDAISRDREKGLIPFYMCATLGTTFVCSFDNLKELGPICANENIWLHVDAAYAGTAFVCRSWMAGIEHADSLTFLPCKIMLTNFYSCIMWAKDTSIIEKTLRVEQDYANNNKSGLEINLMASTLHKTKHRQLSFTRYFHSLKTWFMLKRTGVEGIQLYVRKCVQLCQLLVRWVCEDYRLEMCVPGHGCVPAQG